MDLQCRICGYKDDYMEFAYLCKNGCPACGESDLRRCPACGAECVFSRAESLEEESEQIGELCARLAAITREAGPESLKEGRQLLSRLYNMNLRWNDPELEKFITRRQKELFL
ncbi:MAG: hypothetical protein IBX68_04810 [Dehalococcoidia bacterium]|nr:hypothetical protein [Dehalococcoidia bacterium]